jgi:hypothetical protein
MLRSAASALLRSRFVELGNPIGAKAVSFSVKALAAAHKVADIPASAIQLCAVSAIAYSYFCRRSVWYTPLYYTRLQSAYDVRNVADMARPVVFADPLYQKFRVTELSGNIGEDLWSLLTGQLSKEVTVSMELFSSLQSCRQQLLSMKGKESKDLMTGLCRNAELHDTLNIDRYMAVDRVHINTVYLAYHQLMAEERHKAQFF